MKQRFSKFMLLLGCMPRVCSFLNLGPLPRRRVALSMALGDYSIILEKPLGIILEERGKDRGGVQLKEIVEGGAAESTKMVSGDVLLQVNDIDVANYDFDSIMNLLISTEGSMALTLGDGLGQMDMPKNVVKFLKSTEDAYFVDAVVREAVRECRRRCKKLGDLLQVEVIVGAGVKEIRAQVRFFAIFSTDGVTTFSCNVSATGVRQRDGSIQIVALSCAKDEGLGQTLDIIRED